MLFGIFCISSFISGINYTQIQTNGRTDEQILMLTVLPQILDKNGRNLLQYGMDSGSEQI